jgi:hypothetical protein
MLPCQTKTMTKQTPVVVKSVSNGVNMDAISIIENGDGEKCSKFLNTKSSFRCVSDLIRASCTSNKFYCTLTKVLGFSMNPEMYFLQALHYNVLPITKFSPWQKV